jgi:hypothetical protein
LDAIYINGALRVEYCKVHIDRRMPFERNRNYVFIPPNRDATILFHATATLNKKKEIKKEGYLAQFL